MARRPAPPIDGVCVVDKPAGWTSHDVVAKARGILGTRKVGHSGTLDPDATGVLVLGVGRATRLLRFLTALGKSYDGELVLGTTTSTLDAAGEVTGRFSMDGVSLDDVRAVAATFVGEIEQLPPMVSAVKVGGRRLHELAREGIEVERTPRRVTIGRIDVMATADPLVYRLSVDCGSGTYIRTLAADIGERLGGGAHLRALRRVAVGSFGLDEARPLERLELRPMRDVLRDYPGLRLEAAAVAELLHGRPVPNPPPEAVELPGGTPPAGAELIAAAYGPDGDLVAVVEPAGPHRLRPVLVVAPPTATDRH
jgi:tRNA pseudouridine55 synthase